MLLRSAHPYIVSRSNCRAAQSMALNTGRPTLVSSAKLDTNDGEETFWSMSPISTRNKMGPKTDPWGTPDFTGAGSDGTPSTSTVCFRFVKKERIHFPTRPLIPRFSSLRKVTPSQLYQTPSKNPDKLRPHFRHSGKKIKFVVIKKC